MIAGRVNDQLQGRIYPHVVEMLQKQSHNAFRSLEIGCGDARYKRFVEGRYFGIDLPANKSGSVGPTAFADGQHLPFKNEYFDFVFFVAVLHIIPDAEVTLRECFRILRPGGKLLIIDYNYFGTRRLTKANQVTIGRSTHVWSPWRLATLINRVGLLAKIEWDFTRGYSPILVFLQRFKMVRYIRFWLYQTKPDWSVLTGRKPV